MTEINATNILLTGRRCDELVCNVHDYSELEVRHSGVIDSEHIHMCYVVFLLHKCAILYDCDTNVLYSVIATYMCYIVLLLQSIHKFALLCYCYNNLLYCVIAITTCYCLVVLLLHKYDILCYCFRTYSGCGILCYCYRTYSVVVYCVIATHMWYIIL